MFNVLTNKGVVARSAFKLEFSELNGKFFLPGSFKNIKTNLVFFLLIYPTYMTVLFPQEQHDDYFAGA